MIKMYTNPVIPKIKKILIQTIYDIVKAHGGELKVETLPAGQGRRAKGRSLLFNYLFSESGFTGLKDGHD